jgi:asparagine synthase (glutamine-hydrolysing)
VLTVTDRLSMAHTIEMRVPFLDNDLVDFCLTLPNEYKENKKILKDAFPELPKEILEAKKQGFSSPDWFKGNGNKANRWATTALNTWKDIYDKH